MTQKQKYLPIMLKTETYKNLKQLALNQTMPMTRLVDLLYDEYMKNQKQKADSD